MNERKQEVLKEVLLQLGAIQIIRDTLGGWGGGGSKNVTGQFLLVISLVKVDKKCHKGGGGGSKKCGKSVTYYLNGPLATLGKKVNPNK
jgi:hypothetical protein